MDEPDRRAPTAQWNIWYVALALLGLTLLHDATVAATDRVDTRAREATRRPQSG